MDKNDSLFTLEVDADVKKFQKSLEGAGVDLNELGKKIGVTLSDSISKSISVGVIDGLKKLSTQQLLGAVFGAFAGGGAGGALGAGAGGTMAGSIGAVAGAGLGGGQGGAVGAIGGQVAANVGGSLGVALSAWFAASKAIGTGLSVLGNALATLQGPLSVVGVGFNALNLVMPGVGKGLESVVKSLIEMTAKANPGIFQLWTFAINDLQAVIGHSFTPLLEELTSLVRFFGDLLNTILPSPAEMETLLAPLKDAFADLKSFFLENADTLRFAAKFTIEAFVDIMYVAVGVFEVITEPIILAAKALELLVDPLQFIIDLGKELGLIEEDKLKSSIGAAAQPAQFNSLAGYESQLQTSAFSIGISPEQATADNTERSADTLEELLNVMRNLDFSPFQDPLRSSLREIGINVDVAR
jgi:hypothetical protein